MLENRAKNIRLPAGIFISLLAVLTTINLVYAQTPTPQKAGAPTPQATATAKPIGHGLTGFSNCLRCHTEGFKGAPIMPGDHADYTNDDCEECHEPKVTQSGPVWKKLLPGTTPVPIDHPPAEGQNS